MAPLMRFGTGNNNLASHYVYPNHTQTQSAGLPPPSLASTPNFITPSSMNNPFALNGNSLAMTSSFGASGLGMAGATGLASQAAQMSFASASLQQPTHNGTGDANTRSIASKGRIREVWKGNLAEEMGMLRQLVDKYPYIAMDTEFPGLVAKPMGLFRGRSDYHYQCLRCNVDLLKMIQLGITLFSEEGDSPPPTSQSPDSGIDLAARKYGGTIQLPCTWQFNFKFSLKEDMYNGLSIDTLRQAGLDFQNHEREGIEPQDFAALLISSGLVCDEDVRWITFHGGYDFAYLTKVLIVNPLPDDEVEFDKLMKKFFPSIYDLKYLMKQAIKETAMGRMTPEASAMEIINKFEQKSGLDNLADLVKIKRQGLAHQAGSDSLITGKAFFKIRDKLFQGDFLEEHLGKVWGLGFPDFQTHHSTPQHYHQQLQENTTPNQNGTYPPKTPSTPNTGNACLPGTPAHTTNGLSSGPLTPGGQFSGGAFSSFQFGRQ